MTNVIATENALTGDSTWLITNYAPTQIAAYTDKCSYNPGDVVSFSASMQTVGAYTLKIYRLGWYGGTGGSLKTTISNASGTAQGWWDSAGVTLHNCPTAISDVGTHNWEAGWSITDTWTIPGGSITGIYLANFTTTTGGYQCSVYFAVKGNTTADYVYITPNTTDAAYNAWGSGYSLYTSVTVGVKVSMNKPIDTQFGTKTLVAHQIQFIHWAESQGYNLSYISDIDVHTNATQLKNYKAMLISAHDEYWTKAMRDGVESALAAGVGLGNLGANSGYWQCRLENDNAGNANRTVVCYKVQTVNSNLALDPQYGVTNNLVTTLWRDALLNRPENTMFGIMYSSDVNWPGFNVGWTVDAAATSPYLNGTGLTPGSSYGTDIVGYEWDKVQTSGALNVQIIGRSAITDKHSVADTSMTTTYIAVSGALVFSSGSIDFAYALDGYRYNSTSVATVAGIQTFMVNIMAGLIVPHKSFSMIQV